jgi:hypothetical protein
MIAGLLLVGGVDYVHRIFGGLAATRSPGLLGAGVLDAGRLPTSGL